MLQAAVFDSQFLDLFPFSDDDFVSPEVDIRWCDVAQTSCKLWVKYDVWNRY